MPPFSSCPAGRAPAPITGRAGGSAASPPPAGCSKRIGTGPDREDWPRRLVAAVVAADKPVVVVAHSLGVPTLLHAAPLLPEGKVKGAFLVAPPDLDVPELDPMVANFGPMPTAPLPFPSVLVASRTDPYCSYARAEGFALDWGAAIVDAGDAGHINADAGYGPWPEGSMRLLGLLQSLK